MKNNLYENILNCYENNENFYVRYNNSNNGLCYIYCSSNALYVGGSSESFDNLILKKNRYEWEHISSGTKPEKEIFIRDIFMSWYVNGLSKQNDSYEKIIDVISCECKGYKVRTVGVSSGGYMACLLGIQTKADLCYLLSPQITIRHHYNHCERTSI